VAEWQDVVIATSNVFVNVALIPTLFLGPTPTLFTSVPTALCLFAIAVALWTLELRWSSGTVWLCCLLWTALAMQGGGVQMYFWRAGG
jgi:hypothetical protein